jgi:hypothetical protein
LSRTRTGSKPQGNPLRGRTPSVRELPAGSVSASERCGTCSKVEYKPNDLSMKRYMVSVSQIVCADVKVEAENEEEAREKVLSSDIDREEYCDGHRGSRQIDAIEEITEDET